MGRPTFRDPSRVDPKSQAMFEDIRAYVGLRESLASAHCLFTRGVGYGWSCEPGDRVPQVFDDDRACQRHYDILKKSAQGSYKETKEAYSFERACMNAVV